MTIADRLASAPSTRSPRTREPQYDSCFDVPPVYLGPMTGATWRWNPRRLGMVLARYKFAAKMLAGMAQVAEIGCADAFCSEVVAPEVGRLDLYDFDPVWGPTAPTSLLGRFRVHDIVADGALPCRYDGIYMLDVLEHIRPSDEPTAMRNITRSLRPSGVFLAGVPSLESQAYASDVSKAGHVNCRSGDDLRSAMRAYFANVFLFTMHDEMVGANFSQMAHYLFVLCCGPKI